jgi:ABC-type Mn2+/Zn2+ transport system permease subunit
MEWLIQPFISNDFMLQALLAGVLVSIACSVAGTFVILRGLSFIGDALSHGVLPGIAVAFLVGVPGILGAAVGAGFMIGGISLITNRSRLSSDTAIGLLFVGMLSLGVIIISRSSSFSGDLTRILFGEILGISTQSLILQLAATLIIIVITIVCARPFLLLIVSFQTVGTLLVFGLLIAPAAAGALLARRIQIMMTWAVIFGVLSMYVGLLLSYYFNLAAGASIIMVTVLIFFIVFIIQNIRSRKFFSHREKAHG